MKPLLGASLLLALVTACGSSKPAPATTEVECSAKIALVCAEGSADGCLDGKTLFHVCVAETEQAGPPCAQEIAKVCGGGQVDACLATPPLAASHVCVLPTALAQDAGGPACPEGQGYYYPGCAEGGTAIEAEGCFSRCDAAAPAACGDGFTCKMVTTDPCHNSTCDACGMETQLCIALPD